MRVRVDPRTASTPPTCWSWLASECNLCAHAMLPDTTPSPEVRPIPSQPRTSPTGSGLEDDADTVAGLLANAICLHAQCCLTHRIRPLTTTANRRLKGLRYGLTLPRADELRDLQLRRFARRIQRRTQIQKRNNLFIRRQAQPFGDMRSV